jgi:hypothetical protein
VTATAPPPARRLVSRVDARNRLAALVALAGAALAVIGTSLSWYEVTIAGYLAPGGSLTGWEGRDGRTVVAAAVVAAAVAVVLFAGRRRLAWKVALIVAGVVTAIVAFAGVADTRSKGDKVQDEFGIPAGQVAAEAGAGLWVVAGAGLAELVAGALVRVRES